MLNRENVVQARSTTLLSDLLVLFKFRIVLLLVLAALGGLFLGANGWPGAAPLLIVIVTGTLTAMGSSAWNQYLERRTDALMTRTRARRPLVNGAFVRAGLGPLRGNGHDRGAHPGGAAVRPGAGVFSGAGRLHLRCDLYDLAEAAHQPQHRDRRRGRKCGRAGRRRGSRGLEPSGRAGAGGDALLLDAGSISGRWRSSTGTTMPAPTCRCCP